EHSVECGRLKKRAGARFFIIRLWQTLLCFVPVFSLRTRRFLLLLTDRAWSLLQNLYSRRRLKLSRSPFRFHLCETWNIRHCCGSLCRDDLFYRRTDWE